jgi:hypothetical protein
VKNLIRFAAPIALAAACAACTNNPTVLEADYGKSVREMITAQVAHPETIANPSTAIVTGADPDMVNRAINTMRGDVAKPEDVKRDIVLKVGGK